MKTKITLLICFLTLIQLSARSQTTYTVSMPSSGINTINVTCAVGDIILFQSSVTPLAIRVFRNPAPNYTATPTGTSTSYTVSATDTSYSSIITTSPVNVCTGKITLTAATGIPREAFGNTDFVLFPNPASSSIIVRGLSTGSWVQLINVSGKVLMEFKVPAIETEIDISSLPDGIYFIRNGFSSYRFVKNE